MHLTRQVRKLSVEVQSIGSEVRSLSVAVPIRSGMLLKRTVGVGSCNGMVGSLAGEHPHYNGAAPILTAAVRQVIVAALMTRLPLGPPVMKSTCRKKKTQRGMRWTKYITAANTAETTRPTTIEYLMIMRCLRR